MRVLIDTNIILDVMLKRQPFYENGAKILKLSMKEDMQEFVSASAITDIYYIVHKNLKDKEMVKELLRRLLRIVSIAAVSEDEIKTALKSGWNDFEDSVQYSVALLNDMEGLITRNVGDYKKAELPIWTPEQFLDMMEE